MNAAQNLAKYLSALAVMLFCSALILFIPGPQSPLPDTTASTVAPKPGEAPSKMDVPAQHKPVEVIPVSG
jgi:hypothetical protein